MVPPSTKSNLPSTSTSAPMDVAKLIHDASPPTAAAAMTKKTTLTPNDRPWYIRGGFHVNVFGMGLNVSVPPYVLIMTAASTAFHSTYTPTQIFLVVLISQILAALAEGKRTFFCFVVVPVYLSSLFLVPPTLSTPVLPTIGLALFIAMWRIGICMSVCLHRYASHAAFKCGPFTRLFLNVLGCAANQGGPIWWASQHRCHHKHCDAERDPHSPIVRGVERAFAFFSVGYDEVNEEFVPRHNDAWYLRLLDTFAFSVCSFELCLAYHLFGREGLFVSYTSMWICQAGSLWFNITNHPPPETNANRDAATSTTGKVCNASNGKGRATGWYPAFWFLDFICPYFSGLASESAHADHHDHFMLAKRDEYDVMYHAFVRPLEMLGLIWDVKVAPPE
jgi:fatty-acid desaturase